MKKIFIAALLALSTYARAQIFTPNEILQNASHPNIGVFIVELLGKGFYRSQSMPGSDEDTRVEDYTLLRDGEAYITATVMDFPIADARGIILSFSESAKETQYDNLAAFSALQYPSIRAVDANGTETLFYVSSSNGVFKQLYFTFYPTFNSSGTWSGVMFITTPDYLLKKYTVIQ